MANFARRSTTVGPTGFMVNVPVFDAELLQRWETERARTSTQSASSRASASSFATMSNPINAHSNADPKISFLSKLKMRWEQFSLFGLSSDPRPHIWGTRITSDGRVSKRSVDAIQRIARTHEAEGEMSLVLRDTRVNFSYFDLFDTDHGAYDTRMIRCFSRGANYLELIKIGLGIEAISIAFLIFCFWKVEPSKLFPSYELCFVDFSFDILYLFCIVLQLRTTILDHERGIENCNPRTIVWHYLRSPFFWCEILSLLVPSFLIRRLRELQVEDDIVRPLVLVRVVRGWCVFNLPTRHRFIPDQWFIFARLLGGCLVFGHVLACVWYSFVFEVLGTHGAQDLNMAPNSVGPPTLLDFYGYSLNEGVYLLLAIDRQGKSTAEHLFLAVVLPFAALFHAYIFGAIFLVIQRMGALETRNQEHTLAVNEAMKVLGLSPALQLRIISYFTYERLHRNAHAFDELFRLLSPQLRFELHLYLYTDLIANTGLFRKSKPRIIREMVTLLSDIIFLPGDYVVRFGEHGDSMYFIISGKCAVLASDNETILSVLEKGSYFGEIALLTGVKRTAYVRSDVFCVLAQLTKNAFEPIIRESPEEIDILVGEIINVAEREKVREEAFRYYGMRGGGGNTRASMVSGWAGAASDKRYAMPPSAGEAQHTEGRLRVPSTVFRRSSNLSAPTIKNIQVTQHEATQPDGQSETQPDARAADDHAPKHDNVNVQSRLSFALPTKTDFTDKLVEEKVQPEDDSLAKLDRDIDDLLAEMEPKITNVAATDDSERPSKIESNPSPAQAWATLPARGLKSRLSLTARMSLGDSIKNFGFLKSAEHSSSVVPSAEGVVLDAKVVEEMKALREQLNELTARVVEIPKFLQELQVHFAQEMAGAKDAVVDELWDRFGNMPIDIHELTLAFHDVVRGEIGEEM